MKERENQGDIAPSSGSEQNRDVLVCGDDDGLVIKESKDSRLFSQISSDHSYQVFFENMNEGAVILSYDNRILYGNRSFFDLIGEPSKGAIGKSILNFIKEVDRSYFIDCIMKKKKKKSELVVSSNKKGDFTVFASAFEGVWDKSEALCLLLTDITELKRAQSFIETSESVARVLSGVSNLEVASKSIINLLQSHLGWEVMIIWLWNQERQQLQCFEIAHIQEMDISAFEAATRAMEIKAKQAFSHVCLSDRPVWIKDVTEEYGFIRRNEAIHDGLRGALAFPFNQNDRFGGVVELFRRLPFEEKVDNQMLEFISAIGIALGRYIQRLFNDQTSQEIVRTFTLARNSYFTTNKEGVILNWSSGAERIYGWTAKEMVGSPAYKLSPDKKSGKPSLIIEKLFSGQAIEHVESQRLRKDGMLIWVKSSYARTYDFFGNLSGLIAVEEEITNEKELLDRLLLCEVKFNSFIEITGDWIWELDAEANILFSNIKGYTILGYRSDEIVGRNLFDFILFEEKEKIKKQFEDFVEKKEGWRNLLIIFVHKNGSNRCLENNAKALFSINGELLGFRGASRDITESKNLEKIKNEFVSIMSHELRTPLTSICGALSLLINREMSPERREQLMAIANKNSTRLANLINDITDIEKLKLGKIKFDFKKINLRDVVLEAVLTARVIANKTEIKIMTVDPLPLIEVNGDYWRLLQVMNNLLSNAVKFSPSQGSVIVLMEIVGSMGRVSVKDFGPGIPKDFQTKIFQSFAQADSSAKRAAEGTGLGLYISKYIIDEHGGAIQFETQEGKGTTFSIDIPLLPDLKQEKGI